jgi:hypothetical protein
MPTNAAELRANAQKRRKTADEIIEGLGSFRLQSLSAGDAVAFQADVNRVRAAGGDPESLAFLLLARTLIDDQGQPLFPPVRDGELEDWSDGVTFAKSLDPADYNRLATRALTLNGLTEKAVEDAVGNSAASRPGSTPTGSRESSDTPTST